MKNRICCFAGHREIYNSDIIRNKVRTLAEDLIKKNKVDEFWVGNYGEFDRLCANVVESLKADFPHIELNVVIPYLTKEINDNKEMYYKKYNHIIMADIPETTPNSCRIIKCNEYMVKASGFLICYITHDWGGAAKTLEFAKKQESIEIFNLKEK